MNPEKFTIGVAVAVFLGGAVGLILRRILPEKHTTGGAKDMVGAVVGLLTLLAALVAGLLIWTAYGVYSGQNMAIQSLAAKILQLDLALADYGPEANPVRAKLREGLGKTIDQVWDANDGDANFVANNFAAAIQSLRSREGVLANLHPATDQQTQALATAKATSDSIAQSRLAMSFALSAPVSYPLIMIVVSWAVFLFLGYGLTSGPGNVVPVVAVAVGALAIASAVWLILDLSSPYSGLFRASSAPLEQVLAVMGKE
jgi:hypothetical protein